MLKSPARNSVTTIVWNLQWNASTNSTTWEHLQISFEDNLKNTKACRGRLPLLKVLNFCSWCKRRSGGGKCSHFLIKNTAKTKLSVPRPQNTSEGRPRSRPLALQCSLIGRGAAVFIICHLLFFFYHISNTEISINRERCYNLSKL